MQLTVSCLIIHFFLPDLIYVTVSYARLKTMKYGIFLVVLEYLHVCTCGQGLEYQSHLESMWQVASGGIWRMGHHQPASEVSPLPYTLHRHLELFSLRLKLQPPYVPSLSGYLMMALAGMNSWNSQSHDVVLSLTPRPVLYALPRTVWHHPRRRSDPHLQTSTSGSTCLSCC